MDIRALHRQGLTYAEIGRIVATAARNGTTVLTCDDHFERIGRGGSIVIDG